jgi:hypothetical protein
MIHVKHVQIRLPNDGLFSSALTQKRESPIRVIGMIAMSAWLSAYSAMPMPFRSDK